MSLKVERNSTDFPLLIEFTCFMLVFHMSDFSEEQNAYFFLTSIYEEVTPSLILCRSYSISGYFTLSYLNGLPIHFSLLSSLCLCLNISLFDILYINAIQYGVLRFALWFTDIQSIVNNIFN